MKKNTQKKARKNLKGGISMVLYPTKQTESRVNLYKALDYLELNLTAVKKYWDALIKRFETFNEICFDEIHAEEDFTEARDIIARISRLEKYNV